MGCAAIQLQTIRSHCFSETKTSLDEILSPDYLSDQLKKTGRSLRECDFSNGV
ncbi:hypothetical protein SS50377_23847 [Spironucleus salmonicida]|uniref:Uncharacterized protein n=1 Tax=Spironucleus salmonicida TaxID=348837 RepID=A0A9P8LTV0_9EUKA|nr:hypothetical protein SS50377_23847 [Spironucleus salmonicida]